MEILLNDESFMIDPWIFFLLWAVFFIVYVTFSIILAYHWNNYGGGNPAIAIVQIIYFAVTAPLVILSVSFLLLI